MVPIFLFFFLKMFLFLVTVQSSPTSEKRVENKAVRSHLQPASGNIFFFFFSFVHIDSLY